ncbi:hypothetical protein GOP47_0000194 [Adiantum capillus-veneris]|uniref:Uncharacterized protein n=1 Tax=Adiantum capillus-veneris TaxID=13818 RepID=A0A9D4ZSV4_ADICA|nr:hypothetical protein GOP47_0000194 [Adiantum capillus-veneris]
MHASVHKTPAVPIVMKNARSHGKATDDKKEQKPPRYWPLPSKNRETLAFYQTDKRGLLPPHSRRTPGATSKRHEHRVGAAPALQLPRRPDSASTASSALERNASLDSLASQDIVFTIDFDKYERGNSPLKRAFSPTDDAHIIAQGDSCVRSNMEALGLEEGNKGPYSRMQTSSNEIEIACDNGHTDANTQIASTDDDYSHRLIVVEGFVDMKVSKGLDSKMMSTYSLWDVTLKKEVNTHQEVEEILMQLSKQVYNGPLWKAREPRNGWRTYYYLRKGLQEFKPHWVVSKLPYPNFTHSCIDYLQEFIENINESFERTCFSLIRKEQRLM